MASLAGFQAFITNVMAIPPAVLPSTSSVIPFSYDVALAIVNMALRAIPVPNQFDPSTGLPVTIYDLAVYNLAADNLINYAQDLPNALAVQGSDPPRPFFDNARQKWNITGFVSGVVQSTSDESTSVSLLVQEAAQHFTLGDLQNLKTPWGRQYLAFAQRYGTIWGLS